MQAMQPCSTHLDDRLVEASEAAQHLRSCCSTATSRLQLPGSWCDRFNTQLKNFHCNEAMLLVALASSSTQQVLNRIKEMPRLSLHSFKSEQPAIRTCKLLIANCSAQVGRKTIEPNTALQEHSSSLHAFDFGKHTHSSHPCTQVHSCFLSILPHYIWPNKATLNSWSHLTTYSMHLGSMPRHSEQCRKELFSSARHTLLIAG